MIRLIPILAVIAVLLWQPTKGWSDESDTLLEPDAVLTGTIRYETKAGGEEWDREKKYAHKECPLELTLKGYKGKIWLTNNPCGVAPKARSAAKDNHGYYLSVKFSEDGTLINGMAKGGTSGSCTTCLIVQYTLSGNVERLEGLEYEDSQWRAVVEFSNPDYERRKALLSGQSKETRVAAEPSLKEPEPEQIAILLEPDAVLTGTIRYEIKAGGEEWVREKEYALKECPLELTLKNYKRKLWLEKPCARGQVRGMGPAYRLSVKFSEDGTLINGSVAGGRTHYALSGNVERLEGVRANNYRWRAVVELSNPDYERRKALLSGEANETKTASIGKPALKKLDPEKIARVEKEEKVRRLAEEEKQLAELARLKAAEKERKAEIARLKAEEEELAELARLKAEEERKAEFALRKTEEAKQQAKLASSSVHFGTYRALVIGNDEYTDLPELKNGVRDAKDLALLLEDMYGFEVQTLLNASRDDIIGALSKLRATLEYDHNLLIYYAGHGYLDAVTEEGYWLPVDAGEDDPSNWLPVSTITNMVKAISAKHVMVVADSCYSGTLVRSAPAKLLTAKERDVWLQRMAKKRSRTAMVSGGLEPVLDGGGGKNSPFAKALMDVLRDNQSVMEGHAVYEALKRPVALASSQTPEYSDIRRAGHDGGEFLFVRRGGVKVETTTSEAPKEITTTSTQPSEKADMLFWQSIKGSTEKDDYDAYLEQFPSGIFARLARKKVEKLSKPKQAAMTATQAKSSSTQVKTKSKKSPPPKDTRANQGGKIQIGGLGFPSGSVKDEELVKLLMGNTLFYRSSRSGKSTRYIQDGGKVTFCNSEKRACYDEGKISKWESKNKFCIKEPFTNRGSWWCIVNAKYDDKSGTLKGNATGTGAYLTWKIYRGNYRPY